MELEKKHCKEDGTQVEKTAEKTGDDSGIFLNGIRYKVYGKSEYDGSDPDKLFKSKYHFAVSRIDGWIYLDSGEDDFNDPEPFAYLLKKIQADVKGTIKDVGDTQYFIEGDGMGLLYRWDGLFGISVEIPYNMPINTALNFLSKYF